jgi:hypothetical protein
MGRVDDGMGRVDDGACGNLDGYGFGCWLFVDNWSVDNNKVPVAPVSATSMLLVGVGVDGVEEPARSAEAMIMNSL